jgi:hypothetical protein
MVNMLNHKKWILLPLLSAGFVLIMAYTSYAALLKDIRVGEYDSFTRIVFELDAPAEPEKIELVADQRLAVVFENTTADLIRKIPVDRSPHVGNIQIWEKGNRLTALLAFDFDGFSHKSFSLTDPPRLVLDIHPAPNVPDAGDASSPGLTPDSEVNSSQTASVSASEPAPQPEGQPIIEKSPSEAPEPIPAETRKPQLPGDSEHSAAMPSTSASRPSDARPGRLQFYLVIALVAITIVILALLLLMLLARRHWIDDKSHLTAMEKPKSPTKDISVGSKEIITAIMNEDE